MMPVTTFQPSVFPVKDRMAGSGLQNATNVHVHTVSRVDCLRLAWRLREAPPKPFDTR
jgi:hypothetical protein